MKKQFLKIALVGIMASCFLMLVMGKTANAQGFNWNNLFNSGWGNFNIPQQYNYNYDYGDDDELTRESHAYEESQTQGPGYTTYNYREYTSEYDAMMGNFYAPMTVSYTTTNPMQAMNPFANMFMPHESSSEGSAVGSKYNNPMFSMPTNPMMSYMAQMGAPRYQGYTSQSMFGNTNYMMNSPGMMGGGGFMWGPYSNNAASYGYPGQYGNQNPGQYYDTIW